MRTLLVILVVVAAVYGKPVSYEGYKVYGVTATTDEHYRMLVEWEKAGAYNFWTHPSQHAVTDILVSPTDQPYFELTLRMAQIKYVVKIENVQSLIDEEMGKTYDFDGMVSYEGYKLYSVFAITDVHLKMLVEWEQHGKYDFWTHPTKKGNTDILVAPQEQAFFETILVSANMDFFVKIENVEDLIENEKRSVQDQTTSYKGYKLYGVFASTDVQLDMLVEWEKIGAYDFWTHPSKHASTDILVPPMKQAFFETFLKSAGMDFIVKIEDVEDLIENEKRSVQEQSTSYKGYKLYGVFASTDVQLDMLVEWERIGAYDFWTHPSKHASTDILVPPMKQAFFETFLKSAGMDFIVKIEDVEDLIQNEKRTIQDEHKDYKMYAVFATSDDHLNMLMEWERIGTYEFWTHPVKDAVTYVLVPPHYQAFFENFLRTAGMDFTIVIKSLRQRTIRDQQISYKGYKLYGVTAVNDDQLEILVDWEEHGTFDFWTHPRKNAVIDILVSPSEQAYFEKFLTTTKMHFFVKINNLQDLIDAENRA